MMLKARFKKYLGRGAAFALVFVAIGYLSAWLSLSQCQSITQNALVDSNLKNADLGGKVITHKDIQVETKVAFPFMVKSYYWVPSGMHGTYHEYKYLAFFGFVKQHAYIKYSIV